MNHFQCTEIKDYLHLFNSNGLIVRLPLPQGSIPCDLFLFNIREFALKKGVSKNLIFFNPSFALLVLLPQPLFLFFYPSPSFLLYASPSFWHGCLTTPLFLSLFLAYISHTHFLSFPIFCHVATHTLSFTLFCHVATHTRLHSLCPTYPPTHTHTPSFLVLFCLSYHTFT
jgi:hypothetical protein